MKIYLFPISNKISKINFKNTIIKDVKSKKISKFYHTNDDLKVWGLKKGVSNCRTWNNLNEGDIAIFVEIYSITMTKINNKIYSKEISKILWPSENTWEYIFFVDYILSKQIDKKTFLSELGYSPNDRLMGNRIITEKYIKNFNLDNYKDFSELNTEEDSNEKKEVLLSESNTEEDSNEKKEVLLSESNTEEDSNEKKEVSYSESFVKKIKRDQTIVRQVKERNNWKCQACSFTFLKEDGSYYVEAAHISQLAKSHDDSIENLLALCANCHKMLDLGNKDVKENILKKCGII